MNPFAPWTWSSVPTEQEEEEAPWTPSTAKGNQHRNVERDERDSIVEAMQHFFSNKWNRIRKPAFVPVPQDKLRIRY